MDEFNQKIQDEIDSSKNISIINIIDLFISYADIMRASDIHIDPDEEKIRVRFRIDGVLEDSNPLPKKIHSEIISRIKVMSQMRTDEHTSAQDGRFRTNLGNNKIIDVRVSVMPTYHGENAVLRLLTDHSQITSLENIGFTESDTKKILRAIKKPTGMILVTGPTGSGKTTTMYTLIKMLNNKNVSIITIEDPIEYAISGVEQIQVNPRTGLTFATGLRSILRQDPNIIMVGEIRDMETANIAVNTALTGHLLLSTLHTNDSTTTMPRLLDMKIEPFLVSSTVSIALAQRLVRKICTECKEKKKLSELETKSLQEMLGEKFVSLPNEFYVGRGCKNCNQSGYKGRVVIAEVLVSDEEIRNAILRKASSDEIRKIAIKNGMTTMLYDGITKAMRGDTTIEEILRVTYE